MELFYKPRKSVHRFGRLSATSFDPVSSYFKVVMDLTKFLTENHARISDQWVAAIINTYPEEGAKFFSGSHNQFANPVGHTFSSNISKMLSKLVNGDPVEECAKELDGILRIRAVQGFKPSVALSFVPALKEIVRREFLKVSSEDSVDGAIYAWNIRVDRLMMLGLDLFMACRETLWQQKANQLYSRTHKLLEKANLIKDEEVAG